MRFLRRRSAPGQQPNPLDDVLDAEKAAATALAATKKEAEAWLAGERFAVETSTAAALAALADHAAADETAAQQSALADAATTIARADAFGRTLRALGDAELSALVARHVASIVPGPEP